MESRAGELPVLCLRNAAPLPTPPPTRGERLGVPPLMGDLNGDDDEEEEVEVDVVVVVVEEATTVVAPVDDDEEDDEDGRAAVVVVGVTTSGMCTVRC